jgi:hypothetical protein
MSCISVDGPVPESVLATLRSIPGVRNVTAVEIGEMVDPAFRSATSFAHYSNDVLLGY